MLPLAPLNVAGTLGLRRKRAYQALDRRGQGIPRV